MLFSESGKTGVDKPAFPNVLLTFLGATQFAPVKLPGSSVAEQVTVNHLVVGSIPTRAAILSLAREWLRRFRAKLMNTRLLCHPVSSRGVVSALG